MVKLLLLEPRAEPLLLAHLLHRISILSVFVVLAGLVGGAKYRWAVPRRTQALGPKAIVNGQYTLINMLNKHTVVFN